MQLLPKPQKSHNHQQKLEFEPFHESPSLSVFSAPNAPSVRAPDPSYGHRFLQENLNQRVVILIDGSNLFYAASYLSLEIDYTKLLRCLVQDRRLVRAYFYTGVDRTNEKQQGFLHWMRRNGYRVVSKDLIQFPDGSKKANMEVEIAVDMMTLANHCDTIVLLSGDGNLAYAVNSTAYRGVQVEVVSLRSMTSDSLINVADRYIDLESIREQIQRC
ncbi:MAG: NYN domain-containing protein [Leptolyngbyaceae cyanobacterium HOT.MB2.61]|jgi:uncharacterized LabA/DUF88 family protein|nr:NYN domain-containing protein [Leptolyngbyaceae cyanobacterium HOT.MB2.61]